MLLFSLLQRLASAQCRPYSNHAGLLQSIQWRAQRKRLSRIPQFNCQGDAQQNP